MKGQKDVQWKDGLSFHTKNRSLFDNINFGKWSLYIIIVNNGKWVSQKERALIFRINYMSKPSFVINSKLCFIRGLWYSICMLRYVKPLLLYSGLHFIHESLAKIVISFLTHPEISNIKVIILTSINQFNNYLSTFNNITSPFFQYKSILHLTKVNG